jgi:hypothetical protein
MRGNIEIPKSACHEWITTRIATGHVGCTFSRLLTFHHFITAFLSNSFFVAAKKRLNDKETDEYKE